MVPVVGIGSLSDDLLVKTFLTDIVAVQLFHLPRVCKRWSRLIAQDSKLWRDLTLDFNTSREGALHSWITWVQPKAKAIESCICKLRVYEGSGGAVMVLDQLIGLKSLTLEVTTHPGDGLAVQVLVDLLFKRPAFQTFEVRINSMGVSSRCLRIGSMQYCTQLASLRLDMPVEGGMEALAANAPHLTRLHVHNGKWRGVSALSRIQGLKSLTLSAPYSVGLAENQGQALDLSSVLPSLSHLTSLGMHHQYAGTQLSISNSTHTSLACLTLCGMLNMQCLSQPFAEMSSLTHLVLEDLPLRRSIEDIDATFDDFLDPLRRLPRNKAFPGLKSLSLLNVDMPEFPTALVTISGLTRLHMRPNTGRRGHFVSLPMDVTHLRHLKHLMLDELGHFTVDVDVVLGLSALTLLYVPGCPDLEFRCAGSDELFDAMRALQRHASLVEVRIKGSHVRA